jgi:hypothetical protein
MLFNRDSAIQKCFQKILYSLQGKNLVPCQSFGRRVIPSRRPSVQSTSRSDNISYRLDVHLSKASSVRTTRTSCPDFPSVEKFQTGPACIRPDHSQCSTKLLDFFRKHRYGKITTVQTTWIPVRTCSSIRQVSQFKSRRSGAN